MGTGRASDFARQLRAKQKARRVYGTMERQFRRYYETSQTRRGLTGLNLLQILESRLDNVVFRLGFASSRSQARLLVTHGHFTVNDRRTDVPSMILKEGGRGAAISFNVADDQQAGQAISKIISDFGKLDVLVNNAGIAGPTARVEDIRLELSVQIERLGEQAKVAERFQALQAFGFRNVVRLPSTMVQLRGGEDMREITALAEDADGTLWVADRADSRVLVFFDPKTPDPAVGMPAANLVLGQDGFEVGGAAAGALQFGEFQLFSDFDQGLLFLSITMAMVSAACSAPCSSSSAGRAGGAPPDARGRRASTRERSHTWGAEPPFRFLPLPLPCRALYSGT